MIRSIITAVLLTTIVQTAGAGNAGPGVENPGPDEVIQMHSVNSAKLREIMTKIHEWRENNTADDLKQPGMDQELLDELVYQVEELLYHAELMSIGMPVTNLDKTEMVIFKALGSELYTQALHMQQLVNNQQIRELDQAYRQMDRTCSACHELFRRE